MRVINSLVCNLRKVHPRQTHQTKIWSATAILTTQTGIKLTNLKSILFVTFCLTQRAAAETENCVQIGSQCQDRSRQSLFIRNAVDLAALDDIANAPWLTFVNITGHDDYTGDIDLSFVAHLPELERLSLDDLGPFDAQDIQSNSLSSLNLTNSQPYDYVFVAALGNLQNLHLNNALDRLTALPLERLQSLTGIAIINSEMASIAGIERLENLNRLAITNTAVSDLSPLSGLNLTNVTLVSDKIENLSPLGTSTEITHLFIKGSGITSLDGLSLGPSLVHIEGSNSELSDISALQTATNVERAVFENANITDITSLAGKSHLQHLDLRENPISDLSPLGSGSFPNLTQLDLSDTMVFDLSPLQNLNSVERLALSRIPAKDLTPLAGMISVEGLWLNDTLADDLSPLLDMPALEAFIVDDQQIVTKASLPAYMETR